MKESKKNSRLRNIYKFSSLVQTLLSPRAIIPLNSIFPRDQAGPRVEENVSIKKKTNSFQLKSNNHRNPRLSSNSTTSKISSDKKEEKLRFKKIKFK